MSETSNPVKYLISGGFGGIITVLTGYPMDTVKVRLQMMPIPLPGETPLYAGTFDCFKKTIHLEGFKGLYKGMSALLTGIPPIYAIGFFSYGLGKHMIHGNSELPLTYTEIFLAGAFSGIFTTSVMAPGERIKCLLQIQQNAKVQKYNGLVDCAKQLYKEGGLKSLYKGSWATVLREVPSSGAYFLTYEWVKDKLVKEDSSNEYKMSCTVMAGGLAGVSNWLVSMPQDVIKTRLQTAPEGTYSGYRDVLRQLMAKEGPRALYKGMTPVMLQAFPANAACFVGFELCMSILNMIAPNH